MAALLCILVLVAFFQVLNADFVKWDDDIIIYKNHRLGPLSLDLVRSMFSSLDAAIPYYAPLSLLSWSLIFELQGLSPFGYHLVGLFFHIMSAFLLYSILTRILTKLAEVGDGSHKMRASNNVAAFLGAGFWALSPFRTEQVAWASALSYDQSTFFLFLSLWCYLKHTESNAVAVLKNTWIATALLFFACSILSHPISLSCFFAFFGIDIVLCRIKRPAASFQTRSALLEKLWFAGISVMLLIVSLAVRFLGSGIWEAPKDLGELSFAHRIAQASYSLIYYIVRPWYPVSLSPIYTTFIDFDPFNPIFVMSAIIAVAVAATAIATFKKKPLVSLFFASYFVIPLPVLGLLEYPHFHADRYMTIIASIYSVTLSIIVFRLKDRKFRQVAYIAFSCVLGLFLFLSHCQTKVWKDSTALIMHSIHTLGDEPYRAVLYRRLCLAHLEKRDKDKALQACEAAVRINPTEKSTRLLEYVKRLDESNAKMLPD